MARRSPRYSESAWAALHQRHEDRPITQALAERWLGHLRVVLRETLPDEGQGVVIFERAQAVAFALVNHESDATTQPGERAPGGSHHRSERIAPCGTGARTVKRALLLAQRGKLDELATLVVEVPAARLSVRICLATAPETTYSPPPSWGDLPLLRQLLAVQPSLAQVSDPATDALTKVGSSDHGLRSDIAAEARAKIVYERLIKQCNDPGYRPRNSRSRQRGDARGGRSTVS
jgi:hypothetical protein